MIRNLKIMGLALVAVLAMSAMVASAATASPTFTSTSGATLTGEEEGNIKFSVTGVEVFCEDSSYHGTVPGNSFTSVTVIPTYNKCTASFLGDPINATVTGFGAGGCDFVLHSTGTADLDCAEGKEVTVDAGTCTVHIPPQTGLGSIIYDTVGTSPNKSLRLTINMKKIKETHTKGFLCPFENSGTTETATLIGNANAKASVAGVQVDLTDHK